MRPRRAMLALLLALCALAALGALLGRRAAGGEQRLDAVLVCGGSVRDDGAVPPWVAARLDAGPPHPLLRLACARRSPFARHFRSPQRLVDGSRRRQRCAFRAICAVVL